MIRPFGEIPCATCKTKPETEVKVKDFTLKREGYFLTILTYSIPLIGLVAALVLWATGYFSK